MARKVFLVSMVMCIILYLGTAWAGPKINPGKWEITTTTEMAGMPSQSITHVQCITNDDVVPMSNEASQECQVTDIQIKGDTVSWKISCGDQAGGMEGTGKITYKGDSMHGTMHMTTTGGGNMQINNTLTGRRIGECDGTGYNTSVQSSAPQSDTSGSQVGETITQDAKDVGNAAKDEVKQSTVDEVRQGVKGLFKDLFK